MKIIKDIRECECEEESLYLNDSKLTVSAVSFASDFSIFTKQTKREQMFNEMKMNTIICNL